MDSKIQQALEKLKDIGKIPPQKRFDQLVKCGIIDSDGNVDFHILREAAKYNGRGIAPNGEPILPNRPIKKDKNSD